MAEDWDEQETRESRRRRRREAREQRRAEREAGRESRRPPPSREEAAYRLARRRANLKLSFVWHLVSYATVCFFLLMVAGFRAAFVVGARLGHRPGDALLRRHRRPRPAAPPDRSAR